MSRNFLVITTLALVVSGVAMAQQEVLTIRPVAAAYSNALDRIVMVAGNPNALYTYDIPNGVHDTIALQATPLALSVSLDGLYAAVLHSTSVSYINLSTKTVIRNYSLPAGSTVLTNQSIVLAANWIYLPPTASINIATGAVSGTVPAQGGFAARLAPNGLAIYTAGPQELNISGALPSSNFNYYSNCAGVWFSLDGTKLYDQCGAYNVSTDPTVDLTYYTVFPDVTNLAGYTESTSYGIAVIDDTTNSYIANIGTPIRLYNSYLTPMGVLTLPNAAANGKFYSNYARWVFFNKAGTSLFVVMQADSSSGLLDDYTAFTYNFSNPSPCVPTFASSSATVGGAGTLGSVAVTATGDCLYQATSSASWLQIVSNGYWSGNQTLTYVARPNTSTASRSATLTIGAQTFTVTQSGSTGAGALNPLSVNIVDAAYSKSNDTLVYVSSLPNELHIYNPATGADSAVPLIRRPLAVSVRPDGLFAAVGQEGWVSYVNLSTGAVQSTFKINAATASVVLAGNGYFYGFGPSFSYSYEIATGIQTTIPGYYGSSPARLHPSGKSIYFGGSDIYKLDISAGVAAVTNVSSYDNDCGNLWITDDGDRIVTACSSVYRSSDVPAQDLQANGTLSEAPGVNWADHSIPQASIAVIPGNPYYYGGSNYSEVQLYNDSDLSIRSREDLPEFTAGGVQYSATGKFVFWNNAGTNLYVIEQAPSTANLLASFAVDTVTPATCSFTLSPTKATAPYAGGTAQFTVTTTSQCRWTPTSDSSWAAINANSTGTDGPASFIYTVASNPNAATRTATITVEGHTVTVTQDANPGTLTVSPTVISVPQAGLSGYIMVTTSNSFLGWSAINNTTWTYVYNTGIGSGSAYYNVSQNAAGEPARTGTVVIGNQTITFNQAGSTGPPAYTGNLDAATCQSISGWVADTNRLSQAITVSIYDGTTYLTNITANLSRPDVAAVLGDNGLHGFSYTPPTSLGTGPHNIHVYYESSSIDTASSPKALTCGGVSYAGYIDSSSCSGISGWVADRNRPNISITVSLWDGATQIASTTASASRPDVGAVLGDNGFHGFTLHLPSSYTNGVTHTLQVHYESSATQVGPAFTLTCGSSGGTTNYAGNIDSSSCSGINGWVADRNRLNTAITVSLWDASTQIASVTANASRPDVGTYLGDNGLHGFSLQLPSSYANGVAHTLQVHYESSSTQVGSPFTLTCGSSGGGGSPNYAGFVDSSSCSGINGWAADRNRLNTAITVSLWDPGTQTQIASTTANALRSDVGAYLGDNGLHGYTLQLPAAYANGLSHTLQVRFEASATQLTASPVTLTCNSAAPNYTGNVDILSCSTIAGWAADRNSLNTGVNVSIYDGSSLLTTISAITSRPDVGTAIGDNGLHGFAWTTPASLKDGATHTITIRPGSSSSPLPGPQSLTCQ